MKPTLLIFTLAMMLPLAGREPLAARIVHSDPAKYRHSPSVHGGPGALDYMALMDAHSLETNLQFIHRGVIQPKSGIGAHFHNQCEEMFVILDGEAQFTIDGRTSLLKGPAGAPCRMGHMHAIYNATDKPVQWMNINVTAVKNSYDAFNLNDGRVDAPLDPIPVFMSMRLDRALLRPATAMSATGAVQYRRALDPTVFLELLGLCGSSAAAARLFQRSAHASGTGGSLLRDEGKGRGYDPGRHGTRRRVRNRGDRRGRRDSHSDRRTPLVRK